MSIPMTPPQPEGGEIEDEPLDRSGNNAHDEMQATAQEHLWLHFSRMGDYNDKQRIPIIERGEGPYVYDNHGKRYLDGLAGLFVVQLGHGRKDLAEAARAQAEKLAYFPLWSYAHPASIELARTLAEYTPGDLNRVFFTTGGSEAVESAWKLARQYFKAIGQPSRYKVISRNIAYHGTTLGALSITGIPSTRQPFEPLVPGARKVMNTNRYRCIDCSHLDRAPSGAPSRSSRRSSSKAPRPSRRSSSSRCRTRAGAPPAGRISREGPRDLRPPRSAPRLRRGHLFVRTSR